MLHKRNWLAGELVEVEGQEEDGFPCSRCEAVVYGSKASTVQVQYLEFLTEDKKPLREAVAAERVRPLVPTTVAHYTSLKHIQVGESVEMYMDDLWWQGYVTHIATAGVQVTFHGVDGSTHFLRDYRKLRPRYEWMGGSWRRHVPDKKALLKLGLTQGEVAAAVQSHTLAPTLPAGAPTMRTPPPVTPPRATKATSRHADASPAKSSGAAPAAYAQSLSPNAKRQRLVQVADADCSTGQQAAGASAGGLVGQGGAAEDYASCRSDTTDVAADSPGSPAGEGVSGVVGVEDGPADLTVQVKVVGEEDSGTGNAGNSKPQDEQSGKQKDESLAASRPRREGKSRLVYVRGVPVLKDNMYGLEDEDTMVWRRALKEGNADLAGVEFEKRQRARPEGQRAPKKAPAAPLPPAPEVVARQEHNATIRRAAQAAEAVRARFLVTHLDKLRPFITPQSEAALKARATSSAAAVGAAAPEPVAAQPAEITAVLREYQLEGLAWLVAQYDRGLNAILADEMGLGKTLQTITFLAHLKYVRKVEGPHLVVVPLSVLSSWMSEFKRWCPSMRVVRLHSPDQDERRRLTKEVLCNPDTFDVAVTTYDMVNSLAFGTSLKRTLVWRYLVLDEGHKVKNEESLISAGMRAIHHQHVLMLTGTPVQNNLHELYALLSYLYPDVFTDARRFDDAFNLSKNRVDNVALEAAHYLLRPFMLRRLKEEVEHTLPPKVETRIMCPLSEMQTFWYRRLLLRDSRLVEQMERAEAEEKQRQQKIKGEAGPAPQEEPQQAGAGVSGSTAFKRLMNLLMQLRKVCNHPFLMPDAEPDFDGETTDEEIVAASGKLAVLDRLLAKLFKGGHRLVLFSNFTSMLDVLEDYMQLRGYNYRRLDGQTNRIQRMIDIEAFNRPGSDTFVYLLCTRAGGLGVNLQSADTCVLYDSDWNPQWDLQAMARVHRIGQTKPVHVYRLCTEGTVEDRIQRRAESKLYLDQMVNRGSTAAAEQMEGLSRNEVLAMLKFGADRIFRNNAGVMPTDAQLDAIMDRSKMLAQMEARGQAGAAGPGLARAGPTPAATEAPEPSEVQQELQQQEQDPVVKQEAGVDDAAGPSGAGQVEGDTVLAQIKHSVAEFDAEAAPMSTFMFQGMDYAAIRAAEAATNRAIAAQYWESRKRERKQRLMLIDGYEVLKENNYTMQEGMLHFPGQQRGAPAANEQLHKKKRQRPGLDYEHMGRCMVCWDGGDLVCCDFCPVSCHPECVGLNMEEAQAAKLWSCPHHGCHTCGRNTAKSGGLLFRCSMCEQAYCEDHLPVDMTMLGESELFQALGQRHPKQAAFIFCSPRCGELSQELRPKIVDMMEHGRRVIHQGGPAAVPTQKRAKKGKGGPKKGAAAAKKGR